MALEEHLKILQQGVAAWNEWREKNPELIPDLRKANLGKAHLCLADFNEANLRGANLGEADLSGANLSLANLREAVRRSPGAAFMARLSGIGQSQKALGTFA